MSQVYTLETKKEYGVGDKVIEVHSLIAACKATVLDELWMILDYTFIGLLYYLNYTYIHSRLFSLGLFIWLMIMIFVYPYKRKVKVNSKEELLKVIDSFYEDNKMGE